MSNEKTKLPNDIAGQENFWGTESYHKISLMPYLVTDGIKYILEKGKCFWLFDEFYVMIHDIKINSSLIVCKLQVNEDLSCKLIIEDGNYNKLAEKELSYTNFPAKEQIVWASYSVVNDKNYLIFYLSSEH